MDEFEKLQFSYGGPIAQESIALASKGKTGKIVLLTEEYYQIRFIGERVSYGGRQPERIDSFDGILKVVEEDKSCLGCVPLTEGALERIISKKFKMVIEGAKIGEDQLHCYNKD